MTDLTAVLEDVETSPMASGPLAAALSPELPEKDRPVVASAIQHRCQILLTGDKAHFGPLYGRTIASVEILSLDSFARKLPMF